MSTKHRFCACVLFALVAAVDCALAEDAASDAQVLQTVEQDLQLSQDKQTQLAGSAKDAALAEEQLSNRLVALAVTAAAQERDLARVEKKQSKLKNEIAERSLQLAAQQDVTSQVLAGLQRLEQNPPPALLVAPDDVLTALRSAMMFGAVLPELKQKALELHRQLTDLKNLREDLVLAKKAQTEALASLKQSRLDIKALIVEKKAFAVATTEELTLEKKRAEDLAGKATSLKQLLAALAEERRKTDAAASVEAKARAEVEKQLIEKQNQPAVAFSVALGQVNFPAEGQLAKGFGVATGFGSTLDGIVIATEKLAQVTAPVGGKIEFAGIFRSYGQMVILNPGEGYLVLLAGLEQVDAEVGQSVKAGEPLGEMGDKASKMAQTGGLTMDLTKATTPMLYVEFRHNGDPVDPTPWWIGTRQEAMR
jgi:murein hydrolase activator